MPPSPSPKTRPRPRLARAQDAAAEGATKPPEDDEEVNLHFVALVHREGFLYELDGRRAGPVCHGPTTPATLLSDAAAVAKRFMEHSASLSFNMIALAAPAADD